MIITEKIAKIKEITKSLQEVENFLKRETRAQEEIEKNLQSTNKYLDSQIDKYEEPSAYYFYRNFDVEIYITKAKRKYFDNLEKCSTIKGWKYCIKIQGKFRPKTDDKFRFDAEVKNYGYYDKLETAIFKFEELILEYMREKQKKRQVQLQLFNNSK